MQSSPETSQSQRRLMESDDRLRRTEKLRADHYHVGNLRAYGGDASTRHSDKNRRAKEILYLCSKPIFEPSANNLPRTSRKTFRKNLPQNLPQKPSARNVPNWERTGPKAQNLPESFRKPSAAKSFTKTSAKSFRKKLPRNLPQKTFRMVKGRAEGPEPSGILPESFRKPSAQIFRKRPSAKTFRGTFRKHLPQNLPQKPSAEPSAPKKYDSEHR